MTVDSATLKIDRATEHIVELSEMFKKQRPFSYILETNTNTGERSTFAKQNESIIDRTAVICGDVIHNVRSAIDHAYWEIVFPFLKTEWEMKTAQFPFSEDAAGLDKAVKKRYADRVSPSFYQTLIDLKPHGDSGGNELLYLIHKFDIIDKHKLLIPTGDYTRLSSAIIRKQVPDFPPGLVDCHFGQNNRDVGWKIDPINREQRRKLKIPPSGILEQKLNVPVDIVFAVTNGTHFRPVIPTLHQLVDVAMTTISIMRTA